MNLEKLSKEVVEISKKVGAFLKQEQSGFQKEKIEIKGRNDFVSYVDKEAEKMFGKDLLKLLPETGFIGEEGEIKTGTKEVNWIVDPLDGTTNFVHNIPFYCTSVALIEKRELLLGVVYIPHINECFYAWKGGGAFLNGNSISVSNSTSLKSCLLATGFPYTNFDFSEAYMKLFNYYMHESRGIRRIGSAAIDLAYTACGRFDAFYEYGLNSWDVAAGAIIVKEAGGIVSDFKGGEDYIFGDSIISSTPEIHKEMLKPALEFF